MLHFTPIHLAISKKLGWGDMLAKIAIPAIDTIVSHYIGLESDVTGCIITPQDASDSLTANWPDDDIFGLLWLNDIKYQGSPELAQFISLRNEIEEYMRKGIDYKTAISEWFK